MVARIAHRRARRHIVSGSVEIVRTFALALPETEEKSHFDIPDFRVGGKVFCTARTREPVCMVKLPLEIQAALVAGNPNAIYPAAGAWGRGGATMVRTDLVDPRLLGDLIALAWRCVAPAQLVAVHFPELKAD